MPESRTDSETVKKEQALREASFAWSGWQGAGIASAFFVIISTMGDRNR